MITEHIITRCEYQKDENGWSWYCVMANEDARTSGVHESYFSDAEITEVRCIRELIQEAVNEGDVLACVPKRVPVLTL